MRLKEERPVKGLPQPSVLGAREQGSGNRFEFGESTLSVSLGQNVKAVRWAVSPRKGSCIPESTGFGSESEEG